MLGLKAGQNELWMRLAALIESCPILPHCTALSKHLGRLSLFGNPAYRSSYGEIYSLVRVEVKTEHLQHTKTLKCRRTNEIRIAYSAHSPCIYINLAL